MNDQTSLIKAAHIVGIPRPHAMTDTDPSLGWAAIAGVATAKRDRAPTTEERDRWQQFAATAWDRSA